MMPQAYCSPTLTSAHKVPGPGAIGCRPLNAAMPPLPSWPRSLWPCRAQHEEQAQHGPKWFHMPK